VVHEEIEDWTSIPAELIGKTSLSARFAALNTEPA
jgi:hypothetical protein